MTNIDFSELSEIELAAVSGGVEKFSDVTVSGSTVRTVTNVADTAAAVATTISPVTMIAGYVGALIR